MDKSVGISMKSVMDLEVMKKAKLIAGAAGLERKVLSVNVMEVPDILDWVSPGELLVTTAYSIKNDINALVELIPALEAKGVSGLGIKPKRYIQEVPASVLEVANKLAFPIFEISPETAFPAIITSVLTEIVNSQARMLQDIYNLHRSLTLTMLHGGTMQQISEILYNRFGNSVAILSDFFSSFSISTTDEKKPLINTIIENQKQEQYGHPLSDDQPYSFRLSGDVIEGAPVERLVIPICSDNIMYGHIYIWEDHKTLSVVEQTVIESVSSLIALEIVKKSSMLQMENSHKSGFVNSLLSENQKVHQQALHNAKYFDFNEHKAHQVLVLHMREMKDGVLISSDTLYRLNNILIGILQQIAKSTPFGIVFVNHENTIILLCETPAPHDLSESRAQLLRLVNRVMSQFTQGGLSDLVVVGIGRSYQQPRDLYKSLAEAKRAAKFPLLKKDNGVFYEDMGIYRILSFDNLHQELDVFCLEMIKPLIDYDRDKDLELIPTLDTYFQCQGNMTNLSKMLGVHYNTVVYRLQKIADLTGMDLDDEANLLNLQIALKIYNSQQQ